MPQMMPMLWLMIYFMSLIILMILITLIYFMKLYVLNKNNSIIDLHKTNWNWKW